MTKIEIDTRLGVPFLPSEHLLHPILASALKNRADLAEPPREQAYWPASHFRLDQARLFRDASEADQEAILLGCSRQTLAELYFIEKSGMYFTAKMTLLSESTEERMGYCLFAADEAAHFEWIRRYAHLETVAIYAGNPFIQYLDEILRTEDRPALQFLVQIVLEGWGLHYYQSLARDCRDVNLANLFRAILRDEARHHAGGLALFQARGETETQQLIEHLHCLFSMVQAGPQMVAAEMAQVRGALSQKELSQLFTELDCEHETQRKIDVLRSLIHSARGSAPILHALEAKGALRAYSADRCASLHNIQSG